MHRIWLMALALSNALLLFAALPDGPQPATEAPVATAEPENPAIAEMRRFLEEHGVTVESAAAELRAHLGHPPAQGDPDVLACDGPLDMEHGDPTGAADHEASLDDVLGELVQNGPAALAEAVVDLRSGGGDVRRAEDGELDSDAIALRVGDELIVSEAWVEAAAENPSSVYANIAHEIVGHMGYGTPLGCVLLETAIAGTAVMNGFDAYRAAYLTYVYPETEIYAELQEMAFRTDDALGDDPYIDVIIQIRNLAAAYPPELSDLVFSWIRNRCETDTSLSEDARFYCRAALDQVG